MCNILITGANGQLGNEMRTALSESNIQGNRFFTDVEELDITNKLAIRDFISGNKIDIIVNCAAYTAVDAAQDDFLSASRININAVANIADAAKVNNAKIIHISTDYVFDGFNYRPYTEEDRTSPQSIYGSTKLEGEHILLSIEPESIIIRTSWLYSPYGRNFVKTMLKLGKEKETIDVVCDQIGTPTYAADLAKAVTSILSSGKWLSGIYHFSDEGACSWYDFTKSIHRLAGITSCDVRPVRSSEYPSKVQRPFYSVLDKTKIKENYNIEIPHWEESLQKCIKILEQTDK